MKLLGFFLQQLYYYTEKSFSGMESIVFWQSHNPPKVDSHTNTITRFNLTFFRATFMGLRFGFRAGMGIDGQFTEERQVAPKHQK